MAELFGVKPHTLRFYEKEGILTPQRTKSGVRTYTEESKAQMELTMCLKSTGMPLKDINGILIWSKSETARWSSGWRSSPITGGMYWRRSTHCKSISARSNTRSNGAKIL